MSRLAVEQRPSLRWSLEPEEDPNERRLASPVGPGDSYELAFAELQVDTFEHALPRAVAERDALELNG
jgi:hypothetical protein